MISAKDVLSAIEKHTNVLLYGPPGTGKSYLMKEVQNLFLAKYSGASGVSCGVDTTAERQAFSEMPVGRGCSRWVTFHQGYAYEDFVIGLRPQASDAVQGGIGLEVRAGVLLELAAESLDGAGLLLIDEINRGNASRIFGEFITLMEPDKRLRDDGSEAATTVAVTLPYLAESQKLRLESGVEIPREFRMPRHVYTLASMNSVDKSIAPIDSAIRRRFYVIHLHPQRQDLVNAAGAVGGHHVAQLAVDMLDELNRGVGLHLGPEYMLGQFYLPSSPCLGEMDEIGAKNALVECWRFKILPQLLELFHDRPAVCKKILATESLETKGSKSGVRLTKPSSEEEDEGAAEFIVNAQADASDSQIYEYLTKLASRAAGRALRGLESDGDVTTATN